MQNNECIDDKDQERPHNRFWWIWLIIGCLIITAIIAGGIYDTHSGLDPNTIMRTAVVEGLRNSGADGGAISTFFIVRFDNGERNSLEVPAGTVIRIGHKVLVSERKSLAFGVKHHKFVQYLD